MRKIVKYIFLSVTVIFSTLLILTLIAPFIPPRIVSFLQVLGLFYPYILLANIIVAIIWLCFKKWFLFIPLIPVFAGFVSNIDYFGLNLFPKETVSDSKTIKVVSFNTKVFDLYNKKKNNETRLKIIDYLKEFDADIICLQEFVDDLTDKFSTTSEIMKYKKINYYKKWITYISRNVYEFGLATFSKYPIINSGNIDFPNTQNCCLWTDILIDNDTVRIYNMHLQSNYFNTDDYDLLDKVNNKPNSIEIQQMKNMFSRLTAGYPKRAEQALRISQHINKTRFPKIICVDLNDSPFSYSYRKIKGKLSDTFGEAGFGLGYTFGHLLASVRIDYIFVSEQFIPVNFNTGKAGLSDHRPIVSELEFVKR